MSIERCQSPSCRRPFSVSEYGLHTPGTKERENITCPHCGYTYTEVSNGFFNTRALSASEEADFNDNNPI